MNDKPTEPTTTECIWYQTDECDNWDTECNNSFLLNDGMTPSDCSFIFCPFCSKKITQELLIDDEYE